MCGPEKLSFNKHLLSASYIPGARLGYRKKRRSRSPTRIGIRITKIQAFHYTSSKSSETRNTKTCLRVKIRILVLKNI